MGEEPRRLPSHPDRSGVSTYALAFDPESKCIATSHANPDHDADACVVRVHDIATGATLIVLAGYSNSISGISFSPDGRSLMSTSWDGSVRIWDMDSGEQTALFKDSEESLTIHQACFSPDGKYIAVALDCGGKIGQLQLWELGGGSCVAIFREHNTFVSCIGFTPCGNFLVSGDVYGTVYIRRILDSTV